MRWIARAAMMVALGSTGALAQTDAAPTGWSPTLVVRAVPSRPEGAGASQVSSDWKLVKGEPAAVTIWTGRSLCSLGIGSEPMSQAGQPANVWKMTADYAGERNGAHLIRVTSGFTLLHGRESSTTTTQQLLLAERSRIVLDALSEPLDGSCQVHTVTFEAELVMRATDAELARARYTADLWLVHVDPQGQERREHLVTNVSAGAAPMPFMFNPLAFAIPAVDARQGNARATIRVSGYLRARPLANGDVFVDLDVNRPLFGLDNPDRLAAPMDAPTRMNLRVKDGETAAVDFPPPSSGYSALALAAGSALTGAGVARSTSPSAVGPADAVQVKDNQLVLYTFQFFKGHSTRLLITLKRLP